MDLGDNVGDKMKIKEAISALRGEKKRNFEQSFDLIINLKKVDLRKDNISGIITIPHPFKEKKVCGFLTKKVDLIDTIIAPEFQKYKEKKELKKVAKKYDFFISVPQMMPLVASTFGKSLGPTGKMPTPQLGIIQKEDDNSIKEMLKKINSSVKIRLKQPSVKICVGKENMKDEEIVENIIAVYNGIVNMLPSKKDNVKNILVKLTMSKPIKVEL